MNAPVYLVPGYGVPGDIVNDANYRAYLGQAFNHVYAEAERSGQSPVTVFSGGRSDCFPPYRRTEAGEMRSFFRGLAGRPACRKATRSWRMIVESRALSTLDNLALTKALLTASGVRPAFVTVFCEATRAPRVRRLAREVFSGLPVRIVPVDFDLSANRYLDADFRRAKEARVLRIELAALRDPVVLKRYRDALVRRISFLRSAGPSGHVAAVRKWWEEQLGELADLAR